MVHEEESYLKLAQMSLEDKYSRKQLHQIILKELAESELPAYCTMQGLSAIADYRNGTYWDSKSIRIDALLHTFSDMELFNAVLAGVIVSNNLQPIQSVCARISTILRLDGMEGIQTAAELLSVMAHADMIDMVAPMVSDSGMWQVKTKWVVSKEASETIAMFKYLPPMVCEPKILEEVSDPTHLNDTSDYVLLNKANRHGGELCLDYINQVNAVPLALDEYILGFEEETDKELDTPQKMAQFTLMCESSLRVYKEMLELGNKFFLTWKYDDRGRSYSQGYHVNLQATDYKKALINFHHKEVITL